VIAQHDGDAVVDLAPGLVEQVLAGEGPVGGDVLDDHGSIVDLDDHVAP
jgi:hypothetical protein